jgi:hypothetical protein
MYSGGLCKIVERRVRTYVSKIQIALLRAFVLCFCFGALCRVGHTLHGQPRNHVYDVRKGSDKYSFIAA